MVYGGEQKPGITTGARPYGPRRGRRTGTGLGLLRFASRRSFGVYGLAVLALWGAWSLGVIGCSGPGLGYSWMTDSPGSLFTNMRQSPEDISRLERNAHYYTLMGQPELGLKEMELAHQQDPENLQITDLLAQNYEELGKFEAARQLYQEALTRHGPHAVLANNLCFSYYREGRWQEAEKCFRQTLDHDPGNVSARNNLGLLYCRLGRQDEARRLWQDAEGVAAADAKIGQALAVLGMAESAVYAHEPTPPAAKVAQAPAPKTAVSRLPAPAPARSETSAQPVAPKEAAVHVASKPPAPTPAPVEASPPSETRKQAVVAQKVLVREAPAPVVPQPEPQPRLAPLTAMEESTVYAHEPTPPAAKVAQAPAPKTDVSRLPAPAPARSETSAQPVAPKEAAVHVASKPPAPTPAPVEASPPPETRKQAVVAQKVLVREAPAPVVPQPEPQPRLAPLTAIELVDTAIEVRNGNGARNLARKTRSLLTQEGFTVARIGNHIDFGAAKTVIYYRPEAEKVARTLGAAVFPRAGLESSLKLTKGMDIKILLGADLHQRPQIMARLVGGNN